MKKILFVCLCVISQYAYCQIGNDSDRKEISLRDYLKSIGVYPDVPDTPDDNYIFFPVTDLLSYDGTPMFEYDALKPVGIYAFRTLQPHQVDYILLKYYDECELLYLSESDIQNILDMDIDPLRDFSSVIRDFADYLDRHPDLDEKLKPMYMYAISRVYRSHIWDDLIE